MISLQNILNRHFFKYSLLPILIIEVTLLVIYFGINHYISEKTISTLKKDTLFYSTQILSKEIEKFNSILSEINDLTILIQKNHTKIFENPNFYNIYNKPKFKTAENGVFYKDTKDGSSLYYSSKTNISDKERYKAIFTEAMDPLLKDVVDLNENIVAAYFNSYDDMNRLYPYIDKVYEQYGEHIHMEDYNFYYLANKKNNPNKSVVWTDAYLDPAGNGWMISAIAPIYNNGFLEGVSGIDFTIDSLVSNILDRELPFDGKMFLLDSKGMILAMPKSIEELLGLQELKKHIYDDAITQTITKPEEFNLYKNKSRFANKFKNLIDKDKKVSEIIVNKEKYIVLSNSVIQTNWKLFTLIKEDKVFESTTELKNFSNTIGYLAIIFMTLFYIIFFYLIFKRTKQITQTIVSPIDHLSTLTSTILMDKSQKIEAPKTYIKEIHNLSNNFSKMTNELKQLTKTLENKVEERTQELSQQTKKVTDLLNNAAQGFLSFDKEFLVDDKYSLECENLLGKDLKDKDITELIFENYSDKIPFFKETLIDALDADNVLTSSLVLSLLPSELVINNRAILIDYKIISDNKIMIILTNITDKKKLQSRIKKEQRIQKMIVSIAGDNSQFYEINKNFEEFCKDILLYINISKSIKENSNTINALIHTFKGLFAQLYMERTVKLLHRFESEIMKFTQDTKNNNNDLSTFIEVFDLKDCMVEDLGIISEMLGENFINGDTKIKIDEEFITKLEKKIVSFCSLEKERKHECEEILNEIKKIKYKPLKYYLSSYPKLCLQLCLSFNKSIYDFEIKGSNELNISNRYKPFINSLVHVFRNCCDHGIETKEHRIKAHKDEIGTISCSFESKGNDLYIKITDDGKGIYINDLKNKILQKELVSKKEIDSLSEKEIMNYIFDDNFSTNDSITHISGRGIGLSSVKKELDKLDGSIDIETKLNKGTSFIFRLPFDNVK